MWIKTFHDKGYHEDKLELLKTQVRNMNRESLLMDNKKRNKGTDNSEVAFITGFNKQQTI